MDNGVLPSAQTRVSGWQPRARDDAHGALDEQNKCVATLTAGFLGGQDRSQCSWQHFTARCAGQWGGILGPPEQPPPPTLPSLSLLVEMSTLKRDQEQPGWGLSLNKPSLFRIPAPLFKQSLGVGGLPTPQLVWERPPGGGGEGRLRNARQLLHPC